MDGPEKPAVITHFTLLCNDLDTALSELLATCLEPRDRPVDGLSLRGVQTGTWSNFTSGTAANPCNGNLRGEET